MQLSISVKIGDSTDEECNLCSVVNLPSLHKLALGI